MVLNGTTTLFEWSRVTGKSCDGACSGDVTSATDTDIWASSEAPGGWVGAYVVSKADCLPEERMIRLVLNGFGEIRALSSDLLNRRLKAVHDGKVEPVTSKLKTLGLGASSQETVTASPETIKAAEFSIASAKQESGALRWLLDINTFPFVIGITAGPVARSIGLIGESLGSFADAAVYGLVLCTVGHSVKMQVHAAHLAGILQLILAVGVLVKMVRRFILDSESKSLVMMVIAFVTLIANTSCLLLISKHRGGKAYTRTSWTFSANGVVVNLGVITAGAPVARTGSNYLDLIIGTIAGGIILSSIRRILALKG